jgi:hypothetical protein
MAAKPPAEWIDIGASRNMIPIVMMKNWTTSVSVMDHMPPMTAYMTTMPPPSITPPQNGRSRSPLRTVPQATIEATATKSAYAIMIAAPLKLAFGL